MSTALFATGILLVSTAACTLPQPATPSTSQPPASRQASLDVTVRKDGEPLAGVPLIVRSAGRTLAKAGGTTDEQGKLSVHWAEQPGDVAVRVELGVPPGAPEAEFAAILDRCRVLATANTFHNAYDTTLTNDQSSLSMSIDVSAAVTVTLHTTPPLRASKGAVQVPGVSNHAHSSTREGIVSIGGLPRNNKSVAYAASANRLVAIPLPPCAVDTDLGEVALPAALADNATARVHINTLVSAPWYPPDLANGVTLVPTTADHFYLFGVNAETHWAYDNPNATNPRDLPIPAGTYWVLPGTFWAHWPVHSRFMEKLLAGVDMAAAGVTRITVAEGQCVTAELDAPATVAAILAAPDTPPGNP